MGPSSSGRGTSCALALSAPRSLSCALQACPTACGCFVGPENTGVRARQPPAQPRHVCHLAPISHTLSSQSWGASEEPLAAGLGSPRTPRMQDQARGDGGHTAWVPIATGTRVVSRRPWGPPLGGSMGRWRHLMAPRAAPGAGRAIGKSASASRSHPDRSGCPAGSWVGAPRPSPLLPAPP